MNPPDTIQQAYEERFAGRLLDVLIRAGLILALALLCYKVFAPFLTLMVWALTLAIALYPVHRYVAARLGGRDGWAATLTCASPGGDGSEGSCCSCASARTRKGSRGLSKYISAIR